MSHQPVRVFFPAAMDWGIAHYRIIQPASLLRKLGHHCSVIQTTYLSDDEFKVLDPDSLIFQSQFSDEMIERLRSYRAIKPSVHIAYELNDVMWSFPDRSIVKDKFPPDLVRRLETIFSGCDTVVCSNDNLVRLTRSKFHTNAKIVCAPNGMSRVSFEILRDLYRRRKKDPASKPRIGWTGGANHVGDLDIIASLVNKTLDRFQWVFFGLLPPGVDPMNVEYHPPVTFGQYLYTLGMLNLDVALAPLEQHVFNEGKSDLRVVEYGACGYPVVASDIAPYKNTPAILVKNTEDAWLQGIEKALSNPDDTWRQVHQQFDFIIQNHLLEDHVSLWNEAWGQTDFQSVDSPLSHDIVAVSPVIVRKADGTEIPTYLNWEDAQKEHPDASILWVDSKAWIPPHTVDEMEKLLDNTTASVSSFSNRGDFLSYPRIHQINSGTSDGYEIIVRAAKDLVAEPFTAPNPTGVAVLFSNTALRKIGNPRFGSILSDGALSEWGCMAKLVGLTHKVTPHVYSVSSDMEPIQQEEMQRILFRSQKLCPEKQAHIQDWARSFPAVHQIRKDLDVLVAQKSDTYPGFRDGLGYQDWARWFDSPSQSRLEKLERKEPVRFGVILPVYRPDMDLLKETIQSLKNQVYGNWICALVNDEDPENATEGLQEYLQELASDSDHFILQDHRANKGIVAASNTALSSLLSHPSPPDWIFYLDNEDVLPVHAMLMLHHELQNHPEAEIAYTDSDLIDDKGERSSPFFKPNFDYERLLGQNYFNHLTLYKRSRLESLGGLKEGTDGAQDYDLILRYLESIGIPKEMETSQNKVLHIPRILYHWRGTDNSTSMNIQSKPHVLERARNAVLSHLSRLERTAFVGPNPAIPIYQTVRYLVPDALRPKVSIIVPFKDKIEFMDRFLASLFNKTQYPDFEVILINNGSKEKRSKRFIEALKPERVTVLSYPFSFNWSRINNEGAKKATGDFLLFMNNDMEILEPAWLSDMVGMMWNNPDIGTVGARLIYGDGTIQHIGVHTDCRREVYAYHYGRFQPFGSPGYFGLHQLNHEAVAVTGACMMVRKDLFESMGGFNEKYPVNYGDVEFCLRLNKEHRKRNAVCMSSIIFHHESTTRQTEASVSLDHARQMMELRKLADEIDLSDPYWNPNHLATSATLNEVEWPPEPFFWEGEISDRPWAVVVNGREDDWAVVRQEGYRVMAMQADEKNVSVELPTFYNYMPWKRQLEWKDVREFLDRFHPEKTIFYTLGESSPELLRWMVRVLDHIEYRPVNDERLCPWGDRRVNGEPCDNWEREPHEIDRDICRRCISSNGSPFGFVDPMEWKTEWDVFLKNSSQR